MRVNQFVASATGMSRRAADKVIMAGRVSLNGDQVALGASVHEGDDVRLDGALLILPGHYSYVALNKPVGYISSRARQGEDPTIYDLLPPDLARLRPAGRLDRDSSGLMLLSDDGNFIYKHTHPSAGHFKTYDLSLDRPLGDTDVQKLKAGIELEDGLSRVQVITHNGRDVTVRLGEGRNRQLRRTFGALGYGVVRLHRTQIGDYQIGDLAEGMWQTEVVR